MPRGVSLVDCEVYGSPASVGDTIQLSATVDSEENQVFVVPFLDDTPIAAEVVDTTRASRAVFDVTVDDPGEYEYGVFVSAPLELTCGEVRWFMSTFDDVSDDLMSSIEGGGLPDVGEVSPLEYNLAVVASFNECVGTGSETKVSPNI